MIDLFVIIAQVVQDTTTDASSLPTWAILIMAAIPTFGSIAVAYLSNKKSKSAEAKAKELETKKVGRDEFDLITTKYKELYEAIKRDYGAIKSDYESVKEDNAALVRENLQLRERIAVLEARMEAIADE